MAQAGDLKTGTKEPRFAVLTEAEEAMVIAFRRHTLLPLPGRRLRSNLPRGAIAEVQTAEGKLYSIHNLPGLNT